MSNEFVVEGYWRQIQELQKEVARLKKCEQFVQDFVKYGFRIDTMPGDMAVLEAQQAEYQW